MLARAMRAAGCAPAPSRPGASSGAALAPREMYGAAFSCASWTARGQTSTWRARSSLATVLWGGGGCALGAGKHDVHTVMDRWDMPRDQQLVGDSDACIVYDQEQLVACSACPCQAGACCTG